MSFLYCKPSNLISLVDFIAKAAAVVNLVAILTVISTLPPLVTKFPSFRAVPLWKTNEFGVLFTISTPRI